MHRKAAFKFFVGENEIEYGAERNVTNLEVFLIIIHWYCKEELCELTFILILR